MGRIIGIRHRVKRTAEGESRPTQVVILQDGTVEGATATFDLEGENDELDFVFGIHPVDFRPIKAEDKPLELSERHVKWRKVRKTDDLPAVPAHFMCKDSEGSYVATHIATAFEGLKAGDKVAMILGGSGGMLCYALATQAKKLGGTVFQTPPFVLKNYRGDADKNDDAALLAKLLADGPELFYEVRLRDKKLILVREALRARVDAMKDRIACEQRLRQRVIGEVFAHPEAFAGASIEKAFETRRASDVILTAVAAAEAKANRQLIGAVEDLDVYQKLFKPIEGVGPMIASRLISAIADIRRFSSDAKLKAFCGVHILGDGRFARQRSGEVSNWNPDCRQALYLLGEQFNRRPGSKWGAKLREVKASLRATHPEPIEVEGKKRYADGHIHKMAIWRTLTKFVESLYRDWWMLEDPARFAPPTPVSSGPEQEIPSPEPVGVGG